MEELLLDKEKFKAIVDSVADAIILMNKKGKITYANNAAQTLLGYSEEEFTARTFADMVYSEDQQKILKIFNDSLTQSLKSISFQLRNKNKHKQIIWIEGSLSNHLNEEVLGSIVVNFRDISERKKIEEALKDREQRLSSIYDAVNDVIFVLEVEKDNYRFSSVNRSFLNITGLTPDAIIGKSVNDVIPPDSLNIVLEKYRQAIERKEIVRWEETSKYPTGELIGEVAIVPVFNEDGKCYRLVGAVHDVTIRKKAENEVVKLNRELEEKVSERTIQLENANRELESFNYSVSHDLRAPLRAINGFTGIIHKTYGDRLDEDGIKLLEEVESNSIKMDRLIEDLLTFSRLGRNDIKKVDVDTAALVKSIVDEIEISQSDLKLKFNLKTLLPLYAEATLIHQVFVNLINNAVKFSRFKPSPEVEIGSSKKGNEVIYYIRDNGVGFDMKDYDKLFKVFQRLHSTAQFEGTGVGLAIVEKIISRHGGRVWAEGIENEGATFYFSLPLKK